MSKIFRISLAVFSIVGLFSCGKSVEKSSTTGWNYNDQEWGGFEKLDYEGQIIGPNLVPIEGGTFNMGLTEQDVTYEWNNLPRRTTVSSFYMDETEVSNIDYKEYLHWLARVYVSYPGEYRNALPDSLVWRDELAFNEPYVETYFRHPSYDSYPVVGVNWEQAGKYSEWRSDRVNEMILVERGILNLSPDQKDSENFNTETYLSGQYQGNVKKNLPNLANGSERPVKFEDGILLPKYELPTEAQWEYAALALRGNQPTSEDELITDRRIYPWNGNTARYKKHNKSQGDIQANFKRGRGDYMGVAGALNDNASIPGPVRSYLPNDFGLYNMAGNVSEWTRDIYRPMTSTTLSDPDNHDLNSFRGNVFKEKVLDENGKPVEKDSLGRLKYKVVDDSTAAFRDNYRKGNLKNYKDGDADYIYYGYGKTTLLNDSSRVIKGGSWADRLFWLSPGARRFKDQTKSDRTLGFRCSMVRVGAEGFDGDLGGNNFKEGGDGSKVKRRYK